MQENSQQEPKMAQQQFKIKGMHCKSCADKIEEGIKKLTGISEVKVSFPEEQAFIRFNPDQINLNRVKEVIKETGYEAIIEEESSTNSSSGKMVRISLESSSILAILVGITLILTIANTYSNAKIRNQLALLGGGELVGLEEQDTREQEDGSLKEVKPTLPGVGGPDEDSLGPSPGNQPLLDIEALADDDPQKGSKNAPVTIVEFSDYECPFCRRFFDQTLPLIDKNYIQDDKVKYVFRDFPLSFHRNAQKAAEGAECADEQGKFWEYHDKLFENQDALSVGDLKLYAKDLGLDTTKFNDCLDSGEMASEVEKDFRDGSRYGVGGTPAFFINGTPLSGAQPYSVFERTIEQELNKQ